MCWWCWKEIKEPADEIELRFVDGQTVDEEVNIGNESKSQIDSRN